MSTNNLFTYMQDTAISNKFYKRLALVSVTLTVIVTVFYALYYTSTVTRLSQTIYITNKGGEITEANGTSVHEVRHLEAIDHAKQFVRLFFEVDQFTVDRNLTNAYDLGGSCIHGLYQKFNQDTWFSKIKQYNVRQSILIDKVECINTDNPYKVSLDFRVQVISEATSTPDIYTISMVFTIVDALQSGGSRTENNIHGLMIESIDILTFNKTTNQ